MKLKEYLKKNKLTIAAFADSIGLAPFSVERYVKGRLPQPDAMVSIFRETKGAVAPNDFYPLNPSRSGKAKNKKAASK